MEINGFENYLIYEDGKIWSKWSKGRFLKPIVSRDGYLRITLSKDNKPKHMSVHRLIALHYIDNPENKELVDHIDRNKLNNDISNLRWATYSENNINTCIKGAIKFRGVSKTNNRFRACIKIDGKLKHIGYYDTPKLASEAYIKYGNDNNIKLTF